MTELLNANIETRLSREELYELVWSTPMSKLAKRFNLSDVGLAKICKRYNIPRPGVGYWTKRAHGKPLTKKLLPKGTDPSLENVLIIHGLEPTRNESAQNFFVEQLKTLAAREHEPANIIRVGDALHSPHRIVQQTRQAIQNVRADSSGIVCLRTESLLWLQVAKPRIERALRILDAIVKALELRGFQIKSPSLKHKRTACIVWRNREIEFRIRERLKRQDHVATEKERRDQARFSYMAPPRWELNPTGQLELEIQGMVVRDSLKLRVENQINKLLLRLYRHLDNWERQQAEWKRKEEERRVQEQNQIARDRLLQQRRERIKKVLGEADAWHQAELIRRYVKAVMPTSTELDLQEHNWAAWALRQADILDPIERRRKRVNKIRTPK